MIRIADLSIDWQEDKLSFVKDFVSECVDNPVITLNFSEKMSSCHSVQYADCPSEHFIRNENSDILLANENWSEATAFFLREAEKDFALPLAALCSRFSYFDTLLMHASFVSYQDEGVLFTGYSGVGKTTQAELWAKYSGAEIVNGDKAFLREIDGEFFSYGLPWKGSSEYCLNKKASIKAIVVLRQSEENRITLLKDDVTEFLLPHVFLPHWDRECLNNALDTFDKLIRKIPVFLLECRPDEEAVKLTLDAVFG